MPYTAAWTQKNLLPQTQQIMQALRAANDPDKSKRDTRPLHAIISKLPEADTDILASMQSRKSVITGYDWLVQADAPVGAPAAPDIEQQRARDIAQRFRFSGLHNELDTLLNAKFAGVLGVELNWSTGEGGAHVVESYNVIEPVDLRRDTAAILGWSKYQYTGSGNDSFQLVPYNYRENVILATWNPLKGIRNDFDGGLLRTVIYLTVLKHFNWYDWSKVGERYGDPAILARYPRALGQRKDAEGQTEADKVLAWISAIATESGAALPDDIKVEILDLVTKGASAELFEKFIDKVTSKQERILLGQDVVNLAHKTGTYAQATVAGETTANHNWSDLLWLQNLITDQYVISDYVLNYGRPTTGIFPRFVFDTKEIADFRTNAIIVQLLTSSRYELDPAEIKEKTGFTVIGKMDVSPTEYGY